MWAFINESGSIELYNDLPRNWRNVSNFFALESEIQLLNSFNWYSVVDQVPNYDAGTHKRGDVTTVFDKENNVVIRSAVVTPKTLDELDSDQNVRKQIFLEDLRSRRDRLLSATDWTQAADVQAIKSGDWKQSWIEYRQWLRDLPQIYSESPFESITDSNQVEWRSYPE